MADRPWVMRTYSGHSSARASNELYRNNLAKGQTGLSVAFDLPTQTGYDPDHTLARGEVGKVGVPVPHLGEMRVLFDDLPLEEMNTSMTINATAMWLFGMYQALAEEHGDDVSKLEGTTQNDIVKEYLARGTYIFGPEPSRRLTVDLICHAVRHVPKWNPINVCSYHLQEAGATPVEEVAYALATAIGVLDAVRDSGQVSADDLPEVVGRISFFVNSGIRFVEEMCKHRAFGRLWDRITAERYGVTDERLRRFRFGVQVNSLGLTEAQPENNVQRIVLETLGVTLSHDARARAIQLPAWNEALGLPRPWDQQWSLRIQQVLAFETDLLEYDDLFAGSHVVEKKTAELAEAAEAELAWVLDGGGAFAMIDSMKQRLVQSHAERVRKIEAGDIAVIGVNRFTETTDSPLVAALDEESHILVVDERAEEEQLEHLEHWRSVRDPRRGRRKRSTRSARRRSLPRISCPRRSPWRARAARSASGPVRCVRSSASTARPRAWAACTRSHRSAGCKEVREHVQAMAREIGHPIRILVGKPGLDGHSNGAEQIAVAARDAGMEVIYQGIRLTPEQIAAAARDEDVDLVGLSVLSGSHRRLVPETVRLLREAGVDAPVVVGGIIPEADQAELVAAGVGARLHPQGLSPHADRRGARRPRGTASTAVTEPTVRHGAHCGFALCASLAVVAVAAGIGGRGLRRGRPRTGCRARRRRSCGRGRTGRPASNVCGTVAVGGARSRPAACGVSSKRSKRKLAIGRPPASPPTIGRSIPRPASSVSATWPSCSSRSWRRRAARCSRFPSCSGSSTACTRRRARHATRRSSALAAVAWRTMRESDTVFRLGDSVALGVLVDTAEPGAFVVAERCAKLAQGEPGRRFTHRLGRYRVLPDACTRPGRTRLTRRAGRSKRRGRKATSATT